MKYFIITVDTEGDNLWAYKEGDPITTNNAEYACRFQDLCNKYVFKPVWLTNYEMACNDKFMGYVKEKQDNGLCEVGIHVHAWNNPPLHEIPRVYDGNSYLIEYPKEVMRAKFKTTFDLIAEKTGRKPVSHRAGRFAMNEDYYQLLEEFGILTDCSITPGISWENTKGRTRGG